MGAIVDNRIALWVAIRKLPDAVDARGPLAATCALRCDLRPRKSLIRSDVSIVLRLFVEGSVCASPFGTISSGAQPAPSGQSPLSPSSPQQLRASPRTSSVHRPTNRLTIWGLSVAALDPLHEHLGPGISRSADSLSAARTASAKMMTSSSLSCVVSSADRFGFHAEASRSLKQSDGGRRSRLGRDV